MKVSIITVVYNGEKYIEECIKSVLSQTYKDIEYLLIDGNSTDRTFSVAQKYQSQIDILISEPDNGMYDALNKGLTLSTGDIIGILNSDDVLASTKVIEQIVEAFTTAKTDCVYGNLNYINQKDTFKIIRRWKSKQSTPKDMLFGWMPAHPTLYLRKELFATYGNYSLNFGSAADYELMLRFLYKHKISSKFLNILMVNMRMGGMSNQSSKHRYSALINDYKALRNNGAPLPLLTLMLKKISKLKQFL